MTGQRYVTIPSLIRGNARCKEIITLHLFSHLSTKRFHKLSHVLTNRVEELLKSTAIIFNLTQAIGLESKQNQPNHAESKLPEIPFITRGRSDIGYSIEF
jgi:hypothetical protein